MRGAQTDRMPVIRGTGEPGITVQKVGDEAKVANVDAMLEAGIMAGAEDVESDELEHLITTSVGGFGTVRDVLAEDFGEAEEAELAYIPTQMQAVTSLEIAQSVMKMVEQLENDDDVQSVVTNMELSDEIEAAL